MPAGRNKRPDGYFLARINLSAFYSKNVCARIYNSFILLSFQQIAYLTQHRFNTKFCSLIRIVKGRGNANLPKGCSIESGLKFG